MDYTDSLEREDTLRLPAMQTIDAYRAGLISYDELTEELVTLQAANPRPPLD